MAAQKITNPRESFEDLTSKVRSLRALLEMTYGDARETFESLSEDRRDDYLATCADLANECKELVESLGPTVYGGARHG